MLKESNIKEVIKVKTLKEFLEAFQNESYKITIVNGMVGSDDEHYVVIATAKKYKNYLKECLLNATVTGFAIDYDQTLIIEVTT